MAKKVFTLKRKADTEELHLFAGEMTGDYKCSSGLKSICHEMENAESSATVFACKDEDEARKLCAGFGRKVCGTCVSNLYTTY